jgi:hypothetical protein
VRGVVLWQVMNRAARTLRQSKHFGGPVFFVVVAGRKSELSQGFTDLRG